MPTAFSTHTGFFDTRCSRSFTGTATGITLPARWLTQPLGAGVISRTRLAICAVLETEIPVGSLAAAKSFGTGLIARACLAGCAWHHTLTGRNIAYLPILALPTRADGAVVIDGHALPEHVEAGEATRTCLLSSTARDRTEAAGVSNGGTLRAFTQS